MRKLLNINQLKKAQVTARTWMFLSTLAVSLTLSSQSFGQCTGASCNFSITTNTSYTIPAGQTYCLQQNNYSGTITFGNGSVLCIGSGITWTNATLTFTGSTGTINNYGTSSKSFTLPSGYTFNNASGATYSGTLTQSTGSTASNSGTFSGGLTENGGTFTNNSGGTINSSNFNTSSGSTLTNNGSLTYSGGTIAGTFITGVGGTTTMTTNATTSGTGIIIQGTFINNGNALNGTVTVSPTGSLTISNSNGTATVSDSGTVTVSGGTNASETFTVNNGGTLTNNGLLQGGSVLTGNAGSTIINNGTISNNVSTAGTLNNTSSGTISGNLTGLAGSNITNSHTISGGTNSIAGTLTNNSGATIQNAVTESAGGAITNAGIFNSAVTVNGGTFANSGTITAGSPSVKVAGGTFTNSGTIGATTVSSGSFTNTGTMNSTLTVSGGTATLGGTISSTVTVSNGTLSNSATLSNLQVSGGSVTNTGTINSTLNQTGGAITNASGGTIHPTTLSISNSGSLTNNAGGTVTLPTGTNTLPNGYTLTNNGTFNTSSPLTVNVGATLTLNGTETMNGNLTNNGTVNVGGNLTVSGTYSGLGTFNETNGGCNTFTVTTNSSIGTFNGGYATYGGNLIVNANSGFATLTNGASSTLTAPTQQPSGLSVPLTALAVNGSFTSPSASISGYIVLRYIGSSAPSDNPTNYTAYTIGSTVGSSTVVAQVASASTGVKTFTDNIPAGNCGLTVYYRIFSYNGTAGACQVFDLTSPLTGSVVIANPTATITPGGPTTFCAGSSVALTASGGSSYLWSTGATTAATTVSPGTTTTYAVTVTNASGCTATASQLVTVNTVTPTITPGGSTGFCPGGSVVLTAGGGSTYRWSTGASTTAITASPASTSTYTVTVTTASGCSATASQIVTINAVPTPSVNNAVSCFGATVTLTATGGVSYHWSTGATTTSITTATAGTYTVTATNAATCTATASGIVSASSFTPTVNNPATCAGGTDTMHVSGAGAGASYIWSTGATTDTITTTIAGVYSVTVTNSSGCTATANGVATVNALPTPVVPNDTVCAGNIATLTVTGGVIYVWSTGATTSSITTVTAGTYTVTATSIGGCTVSASGMVVLSSVPALTATGGPICSGTPATLTATAAGATFVWSTGATTSSITTTTAGTYGVTATNSIGCSSSASATATTSTVPTPTVNSPGICAGTAATLTATGGASYVWSTGATTTSITVTPATTTTYTVTAANAAGCSATASGTATVNPLPSASVTNGVVCTGGTTVPATLTASGGGSYHWSTGAATASITTSTIGTYTVTVTSAAGCTATASGTVTAGVNPTPTVNSPSGCNGTNMTLTATGGASYVWSTGATTSAITTTASGTYTVTATNAAGCSATASGTATAYPVPTVTAASNSPVLLDSTIKLTSTVAAGTSPYTYSWSGPSSYTSAVANPNITTALPTNGGTYTVTVTDAHSCTASSSTLVILNYTSPGGIPSNQALWLNATTGVTTSGSNVTRWNDQSGLGNNATIVNGTSPTLVNSSLNSHPVVNFGGSGGLQGSFTTAITSTSASAFIVTNTASSNATYTGLFSIANTTGNNTDYNANQTACMFLTGGSTEMATDRNGFLGNYTNANALGNYHVFSSLFSSTANTNYFYTEGADNTNATFSSAAFGSSMYTIGSRYAGGPALYLNGQIAEVILFNTQLSNAQRNQVESYLATKYGFTLNQTTATNYVASNGTVFWNATSNGTYKNNIFGVGIDNISTLSQTQSVSVNTSVLSINSATGLTYYSFLMVSDNGSADTLEQNAALPNSINAALATVWRASQTGSRCTANFVLNTSLVKFGYYAPISASMTPYMLIDSNADGIYETYLAATSTSGSNVTFNTNLKDGARFTFGFKASIDYGDAWSVPTLTAKNGAGHLIVSGVYLGSLIDAEVDGQPSVNALGDDTIGLADEDGVNFNIGVPTTSNIVTMGTNTITVTASCAGYLNAWADLNQDGTYGGGSEYAIQNVALVAGMNTVTFNVSDSVLYGPTSMRFRFAQHLGDVTAATGLATNGEVEDYKIYVTAPLVGACTNGFQNPSFESGPDQGANTYIITSENNMPYWRTTATDQMIEQWGNGYNGGYGAVPSYSGTYFMELEANLYGALYQDVYTTPGTKLSWSFAHRGRAGSDTAQLKIGAPGATVYQATAIDGNTAWGLHSGFYTVPAGQYITRLEFWAVGSYGGNTSIGNFLDAVSVGSTFDYGDAPDSYGTYFASNGPYHLINSNLHLGYGVTCDADGQPSAAANLDSLDDGITFPTPCSTCTSYTVNINAYNNTGSPATIAGWIDFNKNGVFDANERSSVTIPSSASEQSTTMTFTVTAFSAVSTSSYGRFRIANDSTEIATAYGAASSGEVEDYKINCLALPTPVPSAGPSPACARGPLSLTASGTAPAWAWSGPNGFSGSSQDTSLSIVPSNDSGYYRVYAIYANGCVTDSAVYVSIQSCYVNFTGHIFDDANGDGIMNGTDATTDLGKTIYAVLSDNTNKVLQTSLINSTGTFSFTSVPAYQTGLTIVPDTFSPAIGSTSPGPHWPSNWVGTKEQYGTNNSAGSGIDATPNLLALSTGISNITNALLGFDQLPTATAQSYFISYPTIGAKKALIPANGMGWLAGSDPEDGTYSLGSTFTITSIAAMNGNKLFYDANGDGILQSYEQITSYTTITNFDPTKLIIEFQGTGSISAAFNYGSTDAASKTDPSPATYKVQWVGTLPVTLMYFNAEKHGETQSLLTWATASEQDNAYFDIERSADAETWETIGQQKGAGTTQVQTNYSMIDSSPLSGINYYRLKQVDVDGNFKYSDMAQVTFDGSDASTATAASSTLTVYPNPLKQSDKLNIQLKSTTSDNIDEVIITNAMGQEVFRNNLPEIPTYQIIGLNLASGVYIVSVHTQSNSILSSRLVITK